jgi:hypothetical protein
MGKAILPTLCRGAARWQLPRDRQHGMAVRVSWAGATGPIIGRAQ